MKVINRIKKSDDFVNVIRKGHTYRNNSFVVHIIKNHSDNMRVGISVSSKIGNAVVRNRIKRQIRAMCNLLLDYNAQQIDIVIVVRKSYLDNDFYTNKDLLKSLLVSEIGNLQ